MEVGCSLYIFFQHWDIGRRLPKVLKDTLHSADSMTLWSRLQTVKLRWGSGVAAERDRKHTTLPLEGWFLLFPFWRWNHHQLKSR